MNDLIAPTNIVLKGIRQGILINLGHTGSWEQAKQSLIEHIDQQKEFLRGARIALDVGDYVLKVVELSQLRNELSERELFLWAVIGTSPITEQTALTLGLDVRIDQPRPSQKFAEEELGVLGVEEAVMIYKTLRSGMRLEYQGHVVVIGDVNPGAEIIAGGNVVVWGKLGGLVHAGAQGNESAVVCALDLHPTQLRIADQIAVTPKRKGKPQPELAMLIEGKVMSEIWNPKGKR